MTAAGARHHRVLLADDDSGLRRLVSATLGSADFELLQAIDGEEALQLARSSSELQAVRARVWRARSSSRLFDTVALCRDLESLYEQMHRIAAQGAPPGPISA